MNKPHTGSRVYQSDFRSKCILALQELYLNPRVLTPVVPRLMNVLEEGFCVRSNHILHCGSAFMARILKRRQKLQADCDSAFRLFLLVL